MQEVKMQEVKIKIPPLPPGHRWDAVDYSYGIPPKDAIYLPPDSKTWFPVGPGTARSLKGYVIFAVERWVPKIVKTGVLPFGWLTIDSDGAYWWWERHTSDGMTALPDPRYKKSDGRWFQPGYHDAGIRLPVSEEPKITGGDAIWKILHDPEKD